MLIIIILAQTPFAEGITSSGSTNVIIKIHEKIMIELPEEIKISNYDLAVDNSATGAIAIKTNNPEGWITTACVSGDHDALSSNYLDNSITALPLRVQVGDDTEMELGESPIEVLSSGVENGQTYQSLTLGHTGSWNDIPALDHEMTVEFVSSTIV